MKFLGLEVQLRLKEIVDNLRALDIKAFRTNEDLQKIELLKEEIIKLLLTTK